MSLDKSITSGKEHRKPYYKSKVIDRTCRNHGSCPFCESSRTYKNTKRIQAAQDELAEYFDNLKEV